MYSFMTARKQQVVTGSGKSQWITSSTGTPQGCVISPILFSLYMDRLQPVNPSCKMIKYADDIVLAELCKPNSTSTLQQELDLVISWCTSNKLIINTSKTKMIVTNNKSTINPLYWRSTVRRWNGSPHTSILGRSWTQTWHIMKTLNQ